MVEKGWVAVVQREVGSCGGEGCIAVVERVG